MADEDLFGIPPADGPTYSSRFNGPAWGQRGNDIQNGRYVPGTSGADRDVERYRGMGTEKMWYGPQIDRTQSNETRGLQMGSLALLDAAARGQAPSEAEMLAKRQTEDAINAGNSMAASVKGGPGARVAAMRNAQFNNARLGAMGAREAAGARAREMAEARGTLAGATAQARGQDIGLATSQAQLDAQQRALDEQRQQYYEKMGFETRSQELQAEQNNYFGEQKNRLDERRLRDAESQQDYDRIKDAAAIGVGGATGLAGGAARGGGGDTSDVRSKTSIVPVGSLMSLDPYSGGIYREFPADEKPVVHQPEYGTWEKIVPTMPAPRAPRDTTTSDERAKREAYLLGRAHGNENARSGQPVPFAYGGAPKKGEEIRDYGDSGAEPKGSSKKPEARAALQVPAETAQAVYRSVTSPQALSALDAAGRTAALPAAVLPATVGAAWAAPAAAAAEQPPTLVPSVRGGAGGIAGRISAAAGKTRDTTTSDERAKKVIAREEPMADAMRAMEPSAYRYKPQFTPGEQQPGEVNIGPMAQKMAADPVARTAVVQNDNGMLAIDKTKGLKLVMGSLASLQHQVDALEGGKRRKEASA